MGRIKNEFRKARQRRAAVRKSGPQNDPDVSDFVLDKLGDDDGCHPMRYPKHTDPEKGQVFSGVCNVTLCNNRRAIWWNIGTYGLYCSPCAREINKWSLDGHPVCVKLGHKPPIESMSRISRGA